MRKVVDTAFMRADFGRLPLWERIRLLFGARLIVRAELDGYSELDVAGHRLHVDVVRWRLQSTPGRLEAPAPHGTNARSSIRDSPSPKAPLSVQVQVKGESK